MTYKVSSGTLSLYLLTPTPHVCRLLCVDLVLAVMFAVRQHLLTTSDMLVCVLLLQLVELRAKNWKLDASADQFYSCQRLMLADHQVFIILYLT